MFRFVSPGSQYRTVSFSDALVWPRRDDASLLRWIRGGAWPHLPLGGSDEIHTISVSYHNERTIHTKLNQHLEAIFYPQVSMDACKLSVFTSSMISPCSHLATEASSWSLQTSVIMNGSTSVASSQTGRIKSETGTVT